MPKIETLAPAVEGYAGNVRPSVAWQALQEIASAQLVDVRTAAEWTYVGNPDLAPLAKQVLRIEWQQFPAMEVDPRFAEKVTAALKEQGATPQSPVFFICRSGARSARAAEAASAAGWSQAYNVAYGFEGDRDDQQRRGLVNGWKVEGLPWTQN